MDETKKKFYGLVYLAIAIISIMYGLEYTADTLTYFSDVSYGVLLFLAPTFTLSGITFYLAVRCLKN